MNEKYKEIINMPHPVSQKHKQMDRLDRAAQFAPYSALSGYEDSVEETARLTDSRIELDEYEKERINAALTDLLSAPTGTVVSITHFCPDKKKNGGAYVTVTDELAGFDEIKRELTLLCGRIIKIDDVIEIKKKLKTPLRKYFFCKNS